MNIAKIWKKNEIYMVVSNSKRMLYTINTFTLQPMFSCFNSFDGTPPSIYLSDIFNSFYPPFLKTIFL